MKAHCANGSKCMKECELIIWGADSPLSIVFGEYIIANALIEPHAGSPFLAGARSYRSHFVYTSEGPFTGPIKVQ
jgi:hypothetical protein